MRDNAEQKALANQFHGWLFGDKSQDEIDFIKRECAVHETEEALREFLKEAFIRGRKVKMAGVSKTAFQKLIKSKSPTSRVLIWHPGAWRGDCRTCTYLSDFGIILVCEDDAPALSGYLREFLAHAAT